ncbi:MAG: hypothetical protein BGO78_08465 [Chloroflexi bacterium 44-23]|nr:MAG: hypothetical protein BGO78_08465 [Chloroflexi bacterium 44-23]
MKTIPTGTWVEIEQIVLTPNQRAEALPEDTKKVPYILRVSGFLEHDADLGEECTIRTIIGRLLIGRMTQVNPGYSHSFGKTVAELLSIGTEREK